MPPGWSGDRRSRSLVMMREPAAGASDRSLAAWFAGASARPERLRTALPRARAGSVTRHDVEARSSAFRLFAASSRLVSTSNWSGEPVGVFGPRCTVDDDRPAGPARRSARTSRRAVFVTRHDVEDRMASFLASTAASSAVSLSTRRVIESTAGPMPARSSAWMQSLVLVSGGCRVASCPWAPADRTSWRRAVNGGK